jgi:hypothetical protein
VFYGHLCFVGECVGCAMFYGGVLCEGESLHSICHVLWVIMCVGHVLFYGSVCVGYVMLVMMLKFPLYLCAIQYWLWPLVHYNV